MIQRWLVGMLLWLALASGAVAAAPVEDGYDLWLRYRTLSDEAKAAYGPRLSGIVYHGQDPSVAKAAEELRFALGQMLGPTAIWSEPSAGSVILGTPDTSPRIRSFVPQLRGLGREGYIIRSVPHEVVPVTVIAANDGVGVLYGAFHLLRLIQTGAPIDRLDIVERPKVELRLLNHWDNLDRTVERGYAGQSIWDWWKLPDLLDRRYVDYARANASIGINGTVLNNVNAKADSLTAPFIAKAAALADVFRPYGIRVYLSARFSAPKDVGGLPTADPLDPAVARWWKDKASEIYAAIPDFGGFLVKANSEGQPGPQDYKRTHADGANMLAAALKPHGGIVFWRAFVYSPSADDRAKQAYDEFKPLDGKFADNVIVQVKNGPIDFQPREPFSPLFGAMPKTPLALELQITKEYLGFSTHLAYLGSMWEEVLAADTWARGKGSTVAKVIDGRLHDYRHTAMAGVANIGSDRNWSGSHFDQANWYAFGRLAWDPEARARDIAEDWLRMTFSTDPAFVAPATDMMMQSREAVVDYMTPLGLTHLMASGHHYGPGPWVDDLGRPDWNPVYYHRADADGIGFDRTRRGSNAIAQYFPPVARRFASLDTVGDQYLLWFHRIGWDRRMQSGRTLWEELVARYDRGVAAVGAMRSWWAALAPYVDRARHAEVTASLAVQDTEAKWWRDASIAYFQSVSRRPLPAGVAPPARTLEEYRARRFPYAPGN
jgi:alpha-glucuronidase